MNKPTKKKETRKQKETGTETENKPARRDREAQKLPQIPSSLHSTAKQLKSVAIKR